MNKYELAAKQKEDLLKQLKEGKTIILEGYFTDLEITWHKEIWTYKNNEYTCLCMEVYNKDQEEDEDFIINEDESTIEEYFHFENAISYKVK